MTGMININIYKLTPCDNNNLTDEEVGHINELLQDYKDSGTLNDFWIGNKSTEMQLRIREYILNNSWVEVTKHEGWE